MAQAKRVLSTPPINMSAINPVDETRHHQRRQPRRSCHAVAAAVPNTGTATADPAFALIAEKLTADVALGEVIDAQDEAELNEGIDPDAVEEAFQRCCVACDVVNKADWLLATTPPTTLAGRPSALLWITIGRLKGKDG
jgi:hypothetical protein